MLQARLVDVSRVEPAPFHQGERVVGDAGKGIGIWETPEFLDLAKVGMANGSRRKRVRTKAGSRVSRGNIVLM